METRRIVKNTSFLFIAQVISYLLVFLYNIYMARYLGPTSFGILTFGLSLISIFGILTDLGLNMLMTREIARDESEVRRYFNNFITIKLVLVLIVFIFSLFLSFKYSGETVYVIILLVLSMVFTTFTSAFYALFQAYEQLEYQSIMVFLGSLFTLIGVLIAIFYHFNVAGFASIYLVVAILSLVYCLIIARRRFILPKISVDLEFWKKYIIIALGFGLTTIFTTVYVWIDSSMLFFITGSEATGLYGAAYRIVLALLFIPIAINAAVFPVMSRLHLDQKDSLKRITERYFKYMLLVGIPMGVGGTLLASRLILFIYGIDYANSISSFQILLWATVFTFANAAFAQFFASTNRQLTVTKITGVLMVVNIALNLILIPRYSYIGASISTLVTEFGVALLLILAYRPIGFLMNKRSFSSLFFKIILASSLMGIVVWVLKAFNIFLVIIVAALFYLGISYLIKVIDEDDVRILRDIRG